MYFHYFVIIFPWKRVGPFIWTNLNPMLCAKFGWNWPSGSGEEDENVKSLWQILIRKAHLSLWLRWAKSCQWFSNLRNISTCIREWPFKTILSKDDLCQVWLISAQCLLLKKKYKKLYVCGQIDSDTDIWMKDNGCLEKLRRAKIADSL